MAISQTKQQIVAIGGGSFASTSRATPIDKYILKLPNKNYPKIAFLPTASGDSQKYIDMFYKAFSHEDCFPSHYSVFRHNHKDLESYILSQDIIYVGGGNTFCMMNLWKSVGLDVLLKKALDKGIILCGISAGSLCWFESGNTDSFGELSKIECLGFLPYSNSPHYDSESNRRPNFQNLISTKQIISGYGIDEGVAIHFVDGKLKTAIRENPNGMAYFISSQQGVITKETILPQNI